MQTYDSLRRVEQRADKQTFHRAVFDTLLALWNGQMPMPDEAEIAALLPLLARWLRAAPLMEPLDRLRLLTARKSLMCLIHASGTNVDAFLETAVGALPTLEQAAPWVRWKLALMASIDSAWAPDPLAWRRIAPEEAMVYVIAGLCDEPISAAGLERFNALAAVLPEMSPVDLPYVFLGDVCYANYILSFATEPRKHIGKRVLGAQARRMLEQRGFLRESDCVPGRIERERPRLAVLAEKIVDGNMMHRCYGRQIEDLRRDFEVTLIAERPSQCPAHAGLARDVVYFDPHPEKLGELIRLVQASTPDILYYPSVGMTPWTFVLSQLRLAPLQIAGLGHPAPTVSRAIDYQAMRREIQSIDAAVSDPPLLYESHPLDAEYCFSEQAGCLHEAWAARRPGAVVRIAIDASSMKLNATFLAALADIVGRHADGARLRFFPNGLGARHRSLRRRLLAWFPDAEFMEATSFERYLEWLSECDFALQAYPFGGTNTTIDLLALGLPVVCLDGPEIHSRIDAVILEQTGLASSLLAKDATEYREIAWRLIDDPAERSRLGHQARLALLAKLRAGDEGSTLADMLKTMTVNQSKPQSGAVS